jgi:hypothetical protein
MTKPFYPVRGSEAVTRRDAVGVSTVALAMPLPKRDVGHGQNCGFTEANAKNKEGSGADPRSKRLSATLYRLARELAIHHGSTH